ncbi:unnamed protein product [Aureobasidium mustum]|uniref:Uncharacterized protein n=1 Tax=Aureobasidium mustum TaxID=2773714 RepID=A0A9N8PGD1_9PEZI|nr:unnamed protein product [Aureobasidium mustum]
MNTNPTLKQLWANLHPVSLGQLLEYKQLWDSMLALCVTSCRVSRFKIGTDEHLMTKIFENEFMLVATYLVEGSCHSSVHSGLMQNIFEGWLKRGVPDLSALSEADKYLAFLQTYVCVDPVITSGQLCVAELANAPELPFDQHDQELFAHESDTPSQYNVQMFLDEELRSPSTGSDTPKLWAKPTSLPGPEYTDNSSEFFPVDTSVCPSFFFTEYQEKWAGMARASARLPYLMHLHCPETGARLATLKFTSALALMTAYLESFSSHPDCWWYFDEFMRHYLDLGDVDPQPTLDYMRNTISPDKPVVIAVPIPE